MLSTKHARKWLMSLCGGSCWGNLADVRMNTYYTVTPLTPFVMDHKPLPPLVAGSYEENSEQQHPRLIKVIFDNEDMARLVLRSANKIRNSQNGDIKEVKIFRDLSQSDREKRKLLVNEMKLKNEDLRKNNVSDSKFTNRGDSVVKVKVDPSKTGQHF